MKKFSKQIKQVVNKSTITNNGTRLNDNNNTVLTNVTNKEGLKRWVKRLLTDREKNKQRLFEERHGIALD